MTSTLDKLGNFGLVGADAPFENASVDFASCNEELTVHAEETVADLEQMLAVALIVWLAAHVWIVEQSKGANLVANNDYGLAKHFSYLADLVVWIVVVVNAFQPLVVAETRSEPLKLEVKHI